MITNFQGRFMDVNSSLCSLFGYTREELLKMSIRDLLNAEELESRPIRFDKLMAGEHLFNKRIMQHKDGHAIPVEANVKKLDEGHIVAIAHDISKLEKAELRMRKDEALFRGIFEKSPIGMSLVSTSGKWMMVNQSLCDILGYDKSELLQLSFKDVSHPDDIAENLNGLQQLLDAKIDVYRTRKRYERKDKVFIWVSLNVSLQRDDAGKPLYFISQVENVSQYKQLEERLIEADEQLKLFVEHSPAALAMFDRNMNYIVTSRRWITDYQLNVQDLTGLNHYEVFPGMSEQWKTLHQHCLQGFIEKKEEDSFPRSDGSVDWLKWEIRPWHKSSGAVGGIIMFTEVITERKLQQENAANQIELLKELSFITSHELRHEYVKLHGVVNLLMDLDIVDKELLEIVNHSRAIFDSLDESIVKLNDKIHLSYSKL